MPTLLMVNKLVRRDLGGMVFGHGQCVGLATRRSGKRAHSLARSENWAVPLC